MTGDAPHIADTFTPDPASRRALRERPAGGAPGPRRPPALYVNQLVSSTLTWRQLGMTLTQRAEIYPSADNVARSTLGIAVGPAPSALAGDRGGGGGGATAAFALHWRIPSWADTGGVRLRLNGALLNVSGLPTSNSGAAAGAGLGFSPPRFGQGAAYVELGSQFEDGSVCEPAPPALALLLFNSILLWILGNPA
jgi:hypothetical protein